MADIYEAYKFLNDSLNLGLTEEQMMVREFMLKEKFAARHGFNKVAGDFNPDEWEFFSELVPQNSKRRDLGRGPEASKSGKRTSKP